MERNTIQIHRVFEKYLVRPQIIPNRDHCLYLI
jgi:hypothetical protein